MRKSVFVVLFVFILAVCCGLCSEENHFPYEWVLIGADAVIVSLAVYALLDQISAAENYERLSAEIDGSTEAGYYRLLYEREKVIGKENIVIVSSIAAGSVLLYTIADFLWLHRFFPDGAKISAVPVQGGAKIVLNRRF